MPAIEGGKKLKIDNLKLKQALTKVVFAASNDDTRPVLTGVYFHGDDKNIYLAATDSYRLGANKIEATAKDVDLLVPVSATQDLLRILGDNEGDVEFLYNDQQTLFKVGDVELVARLIEGKYPNYQKLIPGKFANIAKIGRASCRERVCQ